MEYFGNKEILNYNKIGFLCSRKVPASIILKTYDWATEQRDKGICVVSGFHSKIEKDVFDILAKGAQPIILVLARGMMKRFDKKIVQMIDENRLLIISPFENKVTRPNQQTATKRNQFIAELSDKIYFPFISEKSSLIDIKNRFPQKIIS